MCARAFIPIYRSTDCADVTVVRITYVYIYDMELSADTAATNPKERGPRDFSRGIKNIM